MMFRHWALRPDSGGAGTRRGGLGAIYEIEALSDAEVFLLGDRGQVAPFGGAGGSPTALNRFTWEADEASIRHLWSRRSPECRCRKAAPCGRRRRRRWMGGAFAAQPARDRPRCQAWLRCLAFDC